MQYYFVCYLKVRNRDKDDQFKLSSYRAGCKLAVSLILRHARSNQRILMTLTKSDALSRLSEDHNLLHFEKSTAPHPKLVVINL